MSIKLTFFLLLASFMSVSAGTLAQNITLNTTDAPLKTVLKAFKKQSGYSFIIDQQLLDNAKPVTLHLDNAGIDEALNQLFRTQGLTYTIEAKVITIKEKPVAPAEKPAAPPPPTDIVGRVTNTHNQPLDGASVLIKRTQGGTLTDANGNFTLRGVLATDTIAISYIGYRRQFIKVGTQTSFKVTLQEAENDLDQVTIQAYGETTQRTTTGDIGTVTAKDIEKQPVTNVLTALQGQIPGVVVTNVTGYTSGGISVDIRGRNLIGNFPVDPLYVVDGVPLTILNISSGFSASGYIPVGTTQANLPNPGDGQSPFFSINPADVESITVLKDADATSIYGSRGANGVILITTKKGKAGKAHFDLSVYDGISQLSQGYQLLNSQQYVEMREEALRNDGLPLNIQTAPDIVGADLNRYTNWENYMFGRTGKNDDVEASLSGGDANNTFRIAGGFNYVVDILTASGANERGNLSFNLTHKSPNQRLTVSLTASYAVSAVNTLATPNALTTPPTAPPVYNANGSLNFSGWDEEGLSNPFGSLLQTYTTSSNFLNSDLVISYELVKGLIARANLGYNNNTTADTYINPLSSQDPANGVGQNSAQFGFTFFHNIIIEPQLEYNKLIGKGKLNILAGASAQDATTTAVSELGLGYPNDTYLTSLAGATQVNATNTAGEYKYVAGFARIGYNWEDKYILNLNGRRDGSTKFGPGRQFGNFGSVGAAYIFSEEHWVKDHLPFMSLGKLRSSYGTTGNDQIPQYQYLTRWTYGYNPYNGNLPVTPQGHTDSLLHWQVNRKLEAAIDLGFLKDRLLFEASWYRNRTNDQLVPFPTPSLTGFLLVYSNSPADVQNTGLETSLNARIIDDSNFKWSTKFNIAFNHNKLLAYPDLSQSPYASQYQIGQSLDIVYLLHFTGIDPQTGQYTFEDKNHDGQITINYPHINDDTYPVDLAPKFNGGFTSNFTWKNWELSLFFYFDKQTKLNVLDQFNPPGNNNNEPVYVLGRWQKPGDITDIAGFTTNNGTTNQDNFFQYSDGDYSDDTFVRLQNLALTYTLPTAPLKKYGIAGGKVFIKAQNLFYLSDFNGLDPESGDIPLPRVVTGGISLTF